jgi:hypothetical protein
VPQVADQNTNPPFRRAAPAAEWTGPCDKLPHLFGHLLQKFNSVASAL